MAEVTRRNAMFVAGAGAAAVSFAGAPALSQGSPIPVPAFAGNHQVKPLKFDPAKLSGLSEKLITSHWQNNYQGSVKGLNTVEQKLAAAMADKDFPGCCQSNCTEPTEDVIFVSREMGFWPKASGPGT
uniref:hypothetical protein n=1 Tax=Altererythrobacter segetis TaxID=1104773 RepID=UPI001FAF4C87|nr:hypothetical protein [Altererythrobacter segetis]